MRRKKASFSLLEILIAFVLAGILFGCIFSNFHQTYKLQSQIEKAHTTIRNRQAGQIHLYSLLSKLPTSTEDERAKDPSEKPEEKNKPEKVKSSWFYTDTFKSSRALWFSLVVDYAKDTRFVGPLTYCLYLDDKTHSLKILTRNLKGHELTEEIMHGIKSWDLSMFDPEKAVWVDKWPKSTSYLPSLIKITVFEQEEGNKNKPVEFSFALASARQPLVFEP